MVRPRNWEHPPAYRDANGKKKHNSAYHKWYYQERKKRDPEWYIKYLQHMREVSKRLWKEGRTWHQRKPRLSKEAMARYDSIRNDKSHGKRVQSKEETC